MRSALVRQVIGGRCCRSRTVDNVSESRHPGWGTHRSPLSVSVSSLQSLFKKVAAIADLNSPFLLLVQERLSEESESRNHRQSLADYLRDGHAGPRYAFQADETQDHDGEQKSHPSREEHRG